MTRIDPRPLAIGVLQVLNVGVAVVWWRLAPGQTFELRTGVLIGVVCVVWTALVFSRRTVLTPREAVSVIVLGVTLPLVWMVAIVLCEVAVVFAMTALVVGFVFFALCPLILWGAFLLTHAGSKRVSRILVGEERA